MIPIVSEIPPGGESPEPGGESPEKKYKPRLTFENPPLNEEIQDLRAQLAIAERHVCHLRFCDSSPLYIKGAEENMNNLKDMIARAENEAAGP